MIKEAIKKIVSNHSLTTTEASQVMEEIMSGKATPAQFGAFVTALRLKGETVDEITGLVKTMRAKAVPINAPLPVVDTCGTGGDASHTFNISTVTAFIVAGAGLIVAKHGNRAMSSRCGSADVLEAIGVKIDLNVNQVEICLREIGIGFLFAPSFHPAMKYAAAPRREIGIRTVFNIIGPLSHPAGNINQLIGVADRKLLPKMASVLQGLGCQHALVVHGEDGLDEVSTSAKTLIYEVKKSTVNKYEIQAEEFGIRPTTLDTLEGGNREKNAAILKDILDGNHGPARDIVVLNAAAALLAGDRVEDLKEGVQVAQESIDNGQAFDKMEQLVKLSQKFS